MKLGSVNLNTKVYIIAELSANHNGSLELAKKTIQAAKEAGADAIKLQTYTADTLTIDCKKEDFIIEGGTLWDGKSLYELYRQAYTPWEWHEELFTYARSMGLDIFSSPFDKTAVDFLERLDPPAYKIASFEITDYELIRYTASKGRPMIISTGIATIQEIQDAVDICRSERNEEIVLLKCTSAYPAPLEEANLRTIPNMRETFDTMVGFSDHTAGIVAPVAAVSLGARVIEKHFILDRSIGGPDADFSLDKTEFAQMVQAVRDTEKLLGRVDYSMTEKKRASRRFSRSLYVTENVKKGERITEQNLRSIRPGYGLHPKYFSRLLGKVFSRDCEAGTRMDWNCIDET